MTKYATAKVTSQHKKDFVLILILGLLPDKTRLDADLTLDEEEEDDDSAEKSRRERERDEEELLLLLLPQNIIVVIH